MMIDETLAAAILTYQEMYIYGRMKIGVCNQQTLTDTVRTKDFGRYCVNKCISEIIPLVEQIPEKELFKLLVLTTYTDFDEVLRDKDLEKYYGGFDTIEFATDYNRYEEEFYSFIKEYV